jgi:hypothetical protein
VRRLWEYARTSHCFPAFGVGTLYAILKGAHLVIRQCRSWFGRFGQSQRLDKAEFERRKADVVGAYEPLPEGEITVCVDVKRVDHRPEGGAVWQHEQVVANRKARYHKSGTRTDILGALAPREAQLDLECTPKADGAAVAQFLSQVVARWLEFVVVHWTPTHASWLNLAEPFWSAFQRAALQNGELRHHAAVVEVTVAYREYWCAHPREYHWPKQPRRKRRTATPPLWKRLDAIPIIS